MKKKRKFSSWMNGMPFWLGGGGQGSHDGILKNIYFSRNNGIMNSHYYSSSPRNFSVSIKAALDQEPLKETSN